MIEETLDEAISVDSLELYHLNFELKVPVVSGKSVFKTRKLVIIRLSSGEFSGYSELDALQWPNYESEFLEGSLLVLRQFVIPVISECSKHISYNQLNSALDKAIVGNNHAKSGILNCFLDLMLKRKSIPITNIISNLFAKDDSSSMIKTPKVSVTIGMTDTKDELIKKVDNLKHYKYHIVRLKISPQVPLNWLEALRDSFPETLIALDANGSFESFKQALDYFVKLDELNFLFIDQPFSHEDFYNHRRLADYIKTPIGLDESITSKGAIEIAIEMGAASYFCLKSGRLGGFINTLDALSKIKGYGMIGWIGGMFNSEIGQSFNLALGLNAEFVDSLPQEMSLVPKVAKVSNLSVDKLLNPGCVSTGVEIDLSLLKILANKIEKFEF